MDYRRGALVHADHFPSSVVFVHSDGKKQDGEWIVYWAVLSDYSEGQIVPWFQQLNSGY